MPLVPTRFQPPFWLKNGHVATIFANVLSHAPQISWKRKRLETPDGDFLDLDYETHGNSKAILLIHGLEASSQAPYIRRAARAFLDSGYDVFALNFRGCSGELNRAKRFYSAWNTDDLHQILTSEMTEYEEVFPVGFSLGGNILLRYLGSGERQLPSFIKRAACISAPLELAEASLSLEGTFKGLIYHKRFVYFLKQKIKQKYKRSPELFENKPPFASIRSLSDFDRLVTASDFGFADEWDYYRQASSLQTIPGLKLPVYLLNAKNDPVLSPACFPEALALETPFLFLEMPETGGHIGFLQNKKAIPYCIERSLEFLEMSADWARQGARL